MQNLVKTSVITIHVFRVHSGKLENFFVEGTFLRCGGRKIFDQNKDVYDKKKCIVRSLWKVLKILFESLCFKMSMFSNHTFPKILHFSKPEIFKHPNFSKTVGGKVLQNSEEVL